MLLDHLALSRSTVDRAAERRADPELGAALRADPATAVLVLDGDVAPVESVGGRRELVLVDPATACELASRLSGGAVGDAAPTWVDGWEALYLGRTGDGREYVALARPVPARKGAGPGDPGPRDAGRVPAASAPPRGEWAGLRTTGALLDDLGAGLLTAATALANWHGTHPRCARCGEPSVVVQAGWARRCPACGAEHYPRTDGAVIMAILDPDDRILLGRQARWPQGRFSCLAGFVEPGESLEAAVRREALEEAGVVVADVDYVGSQPWPFPASLMLGFRARATSTDVTVDGVELAEARWWTREELALDVATGELILPPRVSIARRLIESWFGAPFADGEPWT